MIINLYIKHYVALLLISITNNITIAQILDKSKTFSITNSSLCDTVMMNGYVDENNTLTLYNYYGDYEHRFPGFQIMKYVTISNNGFSPVIAPRIVFNDKRAWYYREGIRQEALNIPKGISLDKDALLSMWKFAIDNSSHFAPTSDVYADNSYTRSKLLLVYGYGSCDVVSRLLYAINYWHGGSARYRLMTHHTIIDVISEDKYTLLDSDVEVFYLGQDNQTLLSFKDVLDDRFLIHRTKHFGKGKIYDKIRDNDWSLRYNKNDPTLLRTSPELLQKTVAPKDVFDFTLKPDETIVYCWDKAKKHYYNGRDIMPDFFNQHVISNSRYILSTKFDSLKFPVTFDELQNVQIKTQNNGQGVYPSDKEAYFIYRVDLPFPVLDAHLKGTFQTNTLNDSIEILFSLDSEVTWQKVWTSKKSGIYSDSISLSQYFPYPLAIQDVEIPPYGYSLKFIFHPEDSVDACGIVDSLYIESVFQVSKYFLPTLNLGVNSITYSDLNENDSTNNVKITLEWQESYENTPPNKVTSPTFPLHQVEVDSLYFAFTWEPATDDNGDEIVDYEFMLSDDDRMLFPHSPNFNLYVSAFGEATIRPYFKAKETGWLNDGETYYWRVRAKDARGAWGEWSDTWSFTPHGVMRPINGQAEIAGQSIELSWEQNTTGKKPDYYKIYASDEMNGFSPEQATFFAVSDTNLFVIPFEKDKAPKSFYRISACDHLGQESLISDVIAIPYPYMYAAYDSIRPDTIFRMNLFSNERFYPYYYYTYLNDIYHPIINVEAIPDWLNYESPGVLISTDTNLARKMGYMDSTQRTVVLMLNDLQGGFALQKITFQTTAVNHKPTLIMSDSVVCEYSPFFAYVTSIDGDIAFGDKNNYTVLQKPAWLNYDVKGDTIYLFGIPQGEQGIGLTRQDSLLRIRAVDMKNDSTTVDFLIHIMPHVRILSPIKDIAIEDQPYSYLLNVESYEKGIFISFLNIPKWLQIEEPNQFSGIPDIHNLNDTILRFVTYDKVCNVYAEHEIIISIQHVNHSPVITTTELPALQNGVPYNAKIEAYDIDSLIEDVDLSYHFTPSSLWLTIDSKTGMLSGTPFLEHFEDLTFEFMVCDKQGACDTNVITIPLIPPAIDSGKLLCRIVNSSSTEYYARVQSTVDTEFRYSLYSIDGTLLFSSSKWNISEGTFYLPIDMVRYSRGIYIFVGYENNKIRHSIKFVK